MCGDRETESIVFPLNYCEITGETVPVEQSNPEQMANIYII